MSSAFAFFTTATCDRVWSALIDSDQTVDYLYGLALESAWDERAGIVASLGGRPALLGEVLCVHPHRRLSYLLHAPDAPAVYLTWLIRPAERGSICTLEIDESDAGGSADLEDVWLPVLADLQRLLDAGSTPAS